MRLRDHLKSIGFALILVSLQLSCNSQPQDSLSSDISNNSTLGNAQVSSLLVSVNETLNASPQYQLTPEDLALLQSEAGLSDEETAQVAQFVKN